MHRLGPGARWKVSAIRLFVAIVSLLSAEVRSSPIDRRWFALRCRGDLDLERIRQASTHLLGTHDYRNFCKLDITNSEPTFVRRIDQVQIEPWKGQDSQSGFVASPMILFDERLILSFRYEMCELIVTGSGFLWHQIRCIVALLILIGQGKEDVSLIQSLLDIERYPSTPNYQIASGKRRRCLSFGSNGFS